MRNEHRFFRWVELEYAVRKNLDSAEARSEFGKIGGGRVGADVLADCLDEAANVWIVSRDGALEQRTVHYGLSQRARQIGGRRVLHRHANYVPHAFAVAHDILGEIAAN